MDNNDIKVERENVESKPRFIGYKRFKIFYKKEMIAYVTCDRKDWNDELWDVPYIMLRTGYLKFTDFNVVRSIFDTINSEMERMEKETKSENLRFLEYQCG